MESRRLHFGQFEPASGRAATVVVADGPLQVRAVR